MRIAKLDAARRQLETAIGLYFNDSDPVSIHTLAGAAYEILRDVNKARRGEPMVKDWALDYVKAEFRNTFRDALNQAQNFFKHADRDVDAVLDYDPQRADFLLLDACWTYKRMTRELRPLLGVFEWWALLTWADGCFTYEGIQTVPARLRETWSGLSRREFFENMLPVAEQAWEDSQSSPFRSLRSQDLLQAKVIPDDAF